MKKKAKRSVLATDHPTGQLVPSRGQLNRGTARKAKQDWAHGYPNLVQVSKGSYKKDDHKCRQIKKKYYI